MVQATKRKVRITGSGQSSGGVYDSVHIMGEGQLFGETEADTFECMGNCVVKGNLKARNYRLQGEASIEGDMLANKLTALGQINVQGSVRGSRLHIRGQLEVGGSCGADSFQAKGGFTIQGLLSADRVEVSLYGPCAAQEIGGGRIDVRRSRVMGIKNWFSGKEGPLELTAESIEGDDIYIEHTHAEHVRGNHIIIGPGCRIGHVEYRQTLQKNKSAIVRHEVKI
ncbi:polymer-forming cytoskeletal protein [Paenibacillus mendelii]|uniref:Polymer-forming cytoskeletal protein n=1 Tax=Paenibacillus mendelii TaxID=206163 RepID=A0ABV6JC44_9BACL|nr:polymer-forming cytoskeletal protein [Paenibacillus mendelii]MCQ6562610.1 polymer-forming cytoskeletal protein [Paenibacillus mendelii]